MQNAASWLKFPVAEFDRACSFFNNMLVTSLIKQSMDKIAMVTFLNQQNGLGGAVVKHEKMTPSLTGTMVNLNGGNDLQPILERIPEAGGSVVMCKTHLSNNLGTIAIYQRLRRPSHRLAFT